MTLALLWRNSIITAAQADGLSAQRACGVLGLSPRTWQRWQAADLAPSPEPGGASPLVGAGVARGPRSRPYNALTAREAALVVALIRSPQHADASCRELALALEQGLSPLSVSHVTIWEYQCALKCNGPRGRQGGQGLHRTAPDTDWVEGPPPTLGLGHHVSAFAGARRLLHISTVCSITGAAKISPGSSGPSCRVPTCRCCGITV